VLDPAICSAGRFWICPQVNTAYQPIHTLLLATSQELEPRGAHSRVRKHCRRATLQHLVQPALAAKQAAAAAALAACATAWDTCAAGNEAFSHSKSFTSSEVELALALARSTREAAFPNVNDPAAAVGPGGFVQRLSGVTTSSQQLELLRAVRIADVDDIVLLRLLMAAQSAVGELAVSLTACTTAGGELARACQQARESAAQVAAVATDLLRAHGRRCECAAELRKAAAGLGIAAEAAVADSDAAAAVKQCLEVHCIDHAAHSRHSEACEECRQLYRELLQLCSKLGLPAPPGVPPATPVPGSEAAEVSA
jgi:hypothetical protein